MSSLFPYTTLFRSARSSHRSCKWRRRPPAHRREMRQDRKSTRLNSSHEWISYAVFCLKKKMTLPPDTPPRGSPREERYSYPTPAIPPQDFPFFFFNDTATTEIYTLSLHDALPI